MMRRAEAAAMEAAGLAWISVWAAMPCLNVCPCLCVVSALTYKRCFCGNDARKFPLAEEPFCRCQQRGGACRSVALPRMRTLATASCMLASQTLLHWPKVLS